MKKQNNKSNQVHRHLTVQIEGKPVAGPKLLKVSGASPNEIAQWIRSMPKIEDPVSVQVPITIEMPLGDWLIYARGAMEQNVGLDTMLSWLLGHESSEFESAGYRTRFQIEYEKSVEWDKQMKKKKQSDDDDPADFWKNDE